MAAPDAPSSMPPAERYQKLAKIGKGSFGDVFKGYRTPRSDVLLVYRAALILGIPP